MITRSQLNDYYQALLRPETYADYCPNGLQVEGAEHIERIAFAVSATRDSINQAIETRPIPWSFITACSGYFTAPSH